MKKLTTCAFLALFFTAIAVHAANWYVVPGGAGTKAGTSWTNAFDFSTIGTANGSVQIASGTINAGDTVWIAGGTYTNSLVVPPTVNGTSGNPVNFIRVTSGSGQTGVSGWSSSFDSQVVITGDPGITVPTSSYFVIDGNEGPENPNQLLTNTRTYGIQCVAPTAYAGQGTILWGWDYNSGGKPNVTDGTFKNIDCVGSYTVYSGQGATSPSRGFDATGYQPCTRTNLLIHDCRFSGQNESIREADWVNSTIEYCYIGNTPAYFALDHFDIDLYYAGTNQTWRYNVIVNSPGDGIAIGPDGYGSWAFYGNIFYNSFQALIKLCDSPATGAGPFLIYNNVFASPYPNPQYPGSASGWIDYDGATYASGCAMYNNIFYNIANQFSPNQHTNFVTDYNAYNTGNPESPVPAETHVISYTGNPFVNLFGATNSATTTGTLSNGSYVITGIPSTSGWQPGQFISDADGYLAYTETSTTDEAPWIISVNSSSSVTVSVPATGSATSENITVQGLSDFHLTSAAQSTFAAGKTLSSPYNLDFAGNTFGSPWYVGAFQFEGPATPGTLSTSGPVTPPTPGTLSTVKQ